MNGRRVSVMLRIWFGYVLTITGVSPHRCSTLALEFPEGCAPCITKRLIAEQQEEDARNAGR